MGDLFPGGPAVVIVGHAGIGARVTLADRLQQPAVLGEFEDLTGMLVEQPEVVIGVKPGPHAGPETVRHPMSRQSGHPDGR